MSRTLSESDRDSLRTWLKDDRFGSVEEWAEDSGFIKVEFRGTFAWFDEDNVIVDDLEQRCFTAYEAMGEAQDEQRYRP